MFPAKLTTRNKPIGCDKGNKYNIICLVILLLLEVFIVKSPEHFSTSDNGFFEWSKKIGKDERLFTGGLLLSYSLLLKFSEFLFLYAFKKLTLKTHYSVVSM